MRAFPSLVLVALVMVAAIGIVITCSHEFVPTYVQNLIIISRFL